MELLREGQLRWALCNLVASMFLGIAAVILGRFLTKAGATVLRGTMGFGAHSRLHTTKVLRLSDDLPVIVEIVDKPEQIAKVLPLLDEMVTEGMITTEKVHIIAYRNNHASQPIKD